MTAFAVATNARLHKVKLGFSAAITGHQNGDAAKYGAPTSMRRNVLTRAMAAPCLLKKVAALGRARAFDVGAVTVVDGAAAWRLQCGLTSSVGVVKRRPRPADGALELDFVSRPGIYTASFECVCAVVMDLAENARPTDTGGVVVVTLAVVCEGRLQIFSFSLSKKDQNVCRMIVNIAGLQKVILESALVEGGTPSERANLLLAIHRDRTTARAQSLRLPLSPGRGRRCRCETLPTRCWVSPGSLRWARPHHRRSPTCFESSVRQQVPRTRSD